jgi:ATP-binding cassette subfamily B protein
MTPRPPAPRAALPGGRRDPAALAWPVARLGEALHALAQTAGLRPAPEPTSLASGPHSDEASIGGWLEAAAAALALEAQAVEALYAEVPGLLRRAAPAILRLPGGPASGVLALARCAGRKVVLLGPDRRLHRLPAALVRDALCRDLDARLGPEIDRLLADAAVPARRRRRARAALLGERLGAARIAGIWLVALPAGAAFRSQARRAGLPRLARRMLVAHLGQHLLLLAAWWVLGRGALAGSLDAGWLLAWGLMLLTVAPFRALELWSQGVLSARAGVLLKRRAMAGVLGLEPEAIRHQGAGQLLGRVLNAEAMETLALTGGHVGLIALVELALAIPVLVLGSGGWPHALALAGWTGVAAVLGWRYLERRRAWTDARLAMTYDLVEQMVGQRTRLAQLPAGRWHEGEDRALERYVGLSREMDRQAALLRVAVPRGWLLLSLAAMAPGFVMGTATPAGLAIGVGGALFAFKSFWKLVRGLSDLAEAAIAWREVGAIFRAAGRDESSAMPPSAVAGAGPEPAAQPAPVVLEAHQLVDRYDERAEPALDRCDLIIRRGERLLLEGPSGGGKSTLASLLVGLRVPRSGLLLLEGLDRHSLGARGWRRRAVGAPQFQENHVLVDTLAFNLLMGRGWPPRPGDLEEAEALCRELGLGGLLDRMPAGLLQMVGESGWQLSHGEKSRLYIARALLQRAELVVLDESFAALDPESLRQALTCVLARARTLLVIAHP